MSSTPVASKHLFLHQVATEPIGTKIRFLCWWVESAAVGLAVVFADTDSVLEYEDKKAFLHVEHRYLHDAAQNVSIAVEITQVLGILNSTDLQAGSWLNVIGYVRRSLPRKNKRKRANESTPILLPQVIIQAVLIWNARAVKTLDYERTLRHQQEVKRLAIESMADRLQD